ncbi:unnamed protein product [Polarella glacialis]|uniref:Uncharacterized protein n=1 Tax=Polarella glacialis TaxID=89957 RepID=A0A813F615_POLGL|nr:unnamed protein product [Polarella glacialis]
MASDELAAQVNSFRRQSNPKWLAFANSQFGKNVAPLDPKWWPADLIRRFLETAKVKQTTTVQKNNTTKVKQEIAKVETELALLFKADPAAFYHWRKFQHQKGLEPSARASEEMVQKFLAMHSAGTLDRFEIASAQLLADFDKVRKEHPAARWLWASVTAREAFGIVNPRGVPAKIVQDFLESYHAGSLEQVDMASDELAAQVNSFRRAGWFAKWSAFANSQFGTNVAPLDPKWWPADLIRRFLETAKVKQTTTVQKNNTTKVKQEIAKVETELALLFKADPAAFYHWRKFQHQKGLEPSARASEEMVQKFLAMHSAGTLDRFEIASAQLLADFDKVRKEHPAARWLWASVTAREAFGIVNPRGVPAKIVQDFLESYHAGSLEQVDMASDELAAQVNSFRRAGGFAKWSAFANSQFGTNVAPIDPKWWPAVLIRLFLAEQSA